MFESNYLNSNVNNSQGRLIKFHFAKNRNKIETFCNLAFATTNSQWAIQVYIGF